MPLRRTIRQFSVWAAIIIALALVAPPFIKLKRFQKEIVEAISAAMGRQVAINDIALQVLPQPGFDLKGLVVYDDPAFSAEPLLRADEVTANLRLSSLWRWRPEISSLSLKSPWSMNLVRTADGRWNLGSLSLKSPWSMNLVRTADGRWNLGSLLTRASQTPSAPTAKPRPEARPRFPYIEGEGGRINLKSGMEKKPFALSDADFSLWLATENEWNVRLKARPVRTDTSLSDTGAVELSGAFGRAARIEDTPFTLRMALQGAPLGQLTQFIYGRDRGWRGSVAVTINLAGTPRDFHVSGTGSVDDFRRYDIILPDQLRLDARCTARYLQEGERLSEIDCSGQNGEISVRGSVTGLLESRAYDLAVAAAHLPMSEVAQTARHAKFALPADLTATGELNAEFSYRTQEGTASWSGGGATDDFRLRSGVLGDELPLGALKFMVAAGEPKVLGRTARTVPPGKTPRLENHETGGSPNHGEMRLDFPPFAVALGGSAPAVVQASISATEYKVTVQGESEVQRLFNVARALGLRAPGLEASGPAKVNLEVAGSWSGFTPPLATGNIQLRNVRGAFKALNVPAQVRTANAVLLPHEVDIQGLAVSFPGTRVTLDGSVVLPRNCDPPQDCLVRFDLHSADLSTDELNRLLNPQLQRVPWYRLLGSGGGTGWEKLHAKGRITVDRVAVKTWDLAHLAAQVEVNAGTLQLSEVHAETLGGKIHGAWQADFAGTEPLYRVSGGLERVSIVQVDSVTHKDWGTGTASVQFTASLTGWDAPELSRSAHAAMDFEWRDGTLQHWSLDGGSTPLRIKRFAGHVLLREQHLEFQQSKVETTDGIYVLSGTASPARLELKLAGRGARAYAVSGTPEKPRITALSGSETQASLGK